MKKNDYVIFKSLEAADSSANKYSFHLGKAKAPTEDGLKLLLEKDVHIEPKYVEITKKQVVLNLGQKPHGGVAYGCDIHTLYQKTLSLESGIDLHLFSTFDEKLEEQAGIGMNKALKRMKAHGLGFVASGLPLVFEVYKKNKAYAGLFRFGKKNSRICLFNSTEHSEISDYIFLHELGHAVDAYLLTSADLRAKWVNLYIQSIKPCRMTLQEVRALYSRIKSAGSLSDWKASFDEETKQQPNLVLRAIKQAHKVLPRDMDNLIRAGDFSAIKALWPSEDLRSTDLAPIVTEYATVNTKELFAEAFSHHLLDKKLPKNVTSLVEESIQYAIGQKIHVLDRSVSA